MQHPISLVLLTTSSLLLLLSLGNAQDTNVLTGEYQPSGAPPVYPDTMGSGRYPGSGSMGSGQYPGSGTLGSGSHPYPGSGSYPSPGSGHPTPDTSKKPCNGVADEWNQVRDKVMSLRGSYERVTRLYQEIQRINLEFKRLWEAG